jgi:RNA binding exosome subunit
MAGGTGEGGCGGGDRGTRAPFPLAGAVVRAFVHSTEDVERVRGCVRAIVGPDAQLDESASRGYHRQPLRVIDVYVRERAALRRILDLLRADPALREDYRLTWERRLDPEEGAVHFRLAKQPLLDGRVVLEPPDGEGDVVKLELRLQAYPASAKRYREIAEGLLC